MHKERSDKRKFDELRDMEAKVGVIPNANGSAMFRIGKTVVLAAVYGPRNLHPKFLQNPKTGILRCFYNMMPFSGSGERIRPGGNRRSKEISLVTRNALLPVLNLEEFPNSTVDVFIEFPQTDAGSRCAGITAAAMALADAGLTMKEMVAAVAVGKIGDELVVDLTKEEEDSEEGATDIPVAVLINSQKVSLLQMDGEISREDLKKALELGVKACQKITEVQKKALLERYKGE